MHTAPGLLAASSVLVDKQGGWVLAFLLLLAMLAGLRWESVKRSILSLEDPRTYAILRVGFAVLTFWVFANAMEHWRFFYSDEGLYTLHEAQLRMGKHALSGWTPGEGFNGLGGLLTFLWNQPSLFYFWDSPQFVNLHLWGFFCFLLLYGLGVFSRTTGIICWFLMNSIYNRNGVYLEGTDSVFRCFWFLLIFAKTGHAWSVDNWLRCRRLKRRGLLQGYGGEHPVYRLVPAWPRYLFVFQLTILYVRTGLVKYGPEWAHGDTLYYALNNDHFYRFEVFTQHLSAWLATTAFRLNTWVTVWWERLFLLVLFGMAARFNWKYQNEAWFRREHAGVRAWAIKAVWVAIWLVLWRVNTVALEPNDDSFTYGATWALHVAYGIAIPLSVAVWLYLGRREAPIVILPQGLPLPGGRRLPPIRITQQLLRAMFLSRRVWLGLGVFFHGFIILFMNIGLFPFIMMMTYPALFTGDELTAILRRWGERLHNSPRWHRLTPAGWERYFVAAGNEPAAAQRAQRRTPGVPQTAHGLLGRILIGSGAGYHCLAISVLLFQPPPPLKSMRNEMRDVLKNENWLRATRTWQNWRMFPSPPKSNLYLRTVVVDANGKANELENNVLHEKELIELTYDRIRKMRRRLVRKDGKRYLRLWANFYCREWTLKNGAVPHKVVLYRIYSRIPSVKWVAEHGAYDSEKLKRHRRKLGSYPCTGDGLLPLYMKQRYGLPVTEADRARAERTARRVRKAFPSGKD